MKQVYTDKMDAMDHEDLIREAKSEAFLQQIAVTSKNGSVFNLYQNRNKSTSKVGNITFGKGRASAGAISLIYQSP